MTTAPPIVFVDCETTGLDDFARPWEIAIIRREPDGSQRTLLAHVQYSLDGLPAGTDPYALHLASWLVRGVKDSQWSPDLAEGDIFFRGTAEEVALEVGYWLRGRPILVGVGVHFDARMLTRLLAGADVVDDVEPWHYGVLDLKAATWATLRAELRWPPLHSDPWAANARLDRLLEAAQLPMRSELLSSAAGAIPPADEERHTALGDARWAERWFDALAGQP